MVKVLIERRCRANQEGELGKLLVELRSKGVQRSGYVSGETLNSLQDPSLWLVISTWLNVDLWKAWESSPERREFVSKIAPLLVEPEKISIFIFVE